MLFSAFDIEGINPIALISFWNPKKNKIQYCLIEEYKFWYGGKEYRIEPGYVTDFASVPGWLWGVFKPIGEHNPADLEHDYLYDHNISDRLTVDKYFYARMVELGVPKVGAFLRYAGVRLGGRKWWN